MLLPLPSHSTLQAEHRPGHATVLTHRRKQWTAAAAPDSRTTAAIASCGLRRHLHQRTADTKTRPKPTPFIFSFLFLDGNELDRTRQHAEAFSQGGFPAGRGRPRRGRAQSGPLPAGRLSLPPARRISAEPPRLLGDRSAPLKPEQAGGTAERGAARFSRPKRGTPPGSLPNAADRTSPDAQLQLGAV